MERMEAGTALYLSGPDCGAWRPEQVARLVRRELARRGMVCPGPLELEAFPDRKGLLVFVLSPVLRWARCAGWKELCAAARTCPGAARRGAWWSRDAFYIALPGGGEGEPPPCGDGVGLHGALLTALAGLSS